MQGPFTTHIRKSNSWFEREIHLLWVKYELGDCTVTSTLKAPAAHRSSAGNTRERRYAITAPPPQEVPEPRPQRRSPAPLSRPPPVRSPPPSECGRRENNVISPTSPWRGSACSSRQPRANGQMDGRTAPGGGAAAPGADPRRTRSEGTQRPPFRDRQ